MKFGAGITLYHPTEENIKYILELCQHVDQMYVFDNSAQNEGYKDLFPKEKVTYSFTGSNDGLSKAFNWFIAAAKEEEMDFLLLLDQDSMFSHEALHRLMRDIQGWSEEKKKEVAVYACKTIPANDPGEYENLGVHPVDRVISSGSLLNIQLLHKHRLFYDERIFVDHVDYEFCDRVRAAGFQILVNDDVLLKQNLGYDYKGVICHSPVRHYYMVRDIGYVNEKREKRLRAEIKTAAYLFRDMRMSFREDKTMIKLLYAVKGYCDYHRRVTGAYKK